MRRCNYLSVVFLVVTFLGIVTLITACSNKNQSGTPPPKISSSTSVTTSAFANPSKTAAQASPSQPTATTKLTPAKATLPDNVIKLKTISFVDQQGIGIEAFKMLIPTDWQYEGGIQWLLDNPGMPAVSQFRVWNPKGTEQFQVFPNQAFFWTDNPGTLQLFPPGSMYFGNEVRQMMNPLDALKQVVIPKFRANVQGLKIVKEEQTSNVVIPGGVSSQSSLQNSTKAGKVRIEYTENGKVYEDEIYCIVEATYYPLQSMFGSYTNTMWGINYIGSFRAEKGKLDTNAKIFQAISESVTLNLKWFNKYVQVVEIIIKMQIQKIQSVGQLGSIIAQTGEDIRQENLALYNQREAMNDRVSQQFAEYVRGVETYYNPLEGKTVELPTGYNNVWVNNLGEYILAENPNYNPNIGGNQNFQRIELAKK